MPIPPSSHDPALADLLRDVSRSFYLTLRVLPKVVREPIGLAYLLARATDTVADTEAVPAEFRVAALDHLRKSILTGTAPPDFSRFHAELPAHSHGNPSEAERKLLSHIPAALEVLGRMETADRERIRQVLEIITSGQVLDVERFANATAQNLVALATPAELDDYTYRVAGCVGEFWTRICRAHLFPGDTIDEAALLEDAVRFGKGLQLVNILRDLPGDLRLGRCYLPSDQLASLGLQPQDLLDPGRFERLVPLYFSQLDGARSHLGAGWRYTLTLPARQIRIRLACAWPILIGLETLGKLRRSNPLDPSARVKIPRSSVRAILMQTLLRLAWPPGWKRLDRWAESRGSEPSGSPFSPNPK